MKKPISSPTTKLVQYVDVQACDTRWVIDAKLIHQEKTKFQDLKVYESQTFGTFFALDDWLQVADKDEFIYHEMMVHVSLAINPKIENVLVIGAGDGGVVRELCKYKTIKHIDMIEIDERVCEISKKYFPQVAISLSDKRVNLMHIDGIKWVKDYNGKNYDLIICDSTDPTDTGKALFTDAFYKNCNRILDKKGLFVCQGESLYYDVTKKVALKTFHYLKKYFFKNWMYQAYIPTYSSGHWMYNFASKSDIDPINKNIAKWNDLKIKTQYYNTNVHIGAFALPNYVIDILEKSK